MTQDLPAQISCFEQVLAVRLPPHAATSSVARILRGLYATKAASAVLAQVSALYPAKVQSVRTSPSEEDRSVLRHPPLPGIDAVQSAAPRLLEAIAVRDGEAAVNALGDMGVLALCPSSELLFGRLEFSVGCVVGPARVVPLVELAILAAELGANERAGVYVANAHNLAPGAPELHDLHTVAGVVALNLGNLAEAKRCLSESIRVCEKNEFACLACSIRAFILLLAERLLERGEDAAVINYFSRCQYLWKHEASRITSWIDAIRAGQKPDFHAPSMRNALDHPALKIQALAIRSSFLPTPDEVASERPKEETQARRDEMRAEYKRTMAEAVKGKLKTGRN
jgi:hypothetical protein